MVLLRIATLKEKRDGSYRTEQETDENKGDALGRVTEGKDLSRTGDRRKSHLETTHVGTTTGGT